MFFRFDASWNLGGFNASGKYLWAPNCKQKVRMMTSKEEEEKEEREEEEREEREKREQR